VYRVLAGKREKKRPLERPRSKWVENIKMDIQEVVWRCMAWNDLTQDRKRSRAVVYAVMNLPFA
jgi:hypothetical protein